MTLSLLPPRRPNLALSEHVNTTSNTNTLAFGSPLSPPTPTLNLHAGAMSSGRLHIPFPRTFLTVNTPTKKSTSPAEPTAAPESQQTAHPFLSNRPAVGVRHASISSVSSVDSVASSPSAPASEPSASPVLKPTLPTFLSLNAKYAAPPKTAAALSDVEPHGFLSNKH